MKYSADEVMQFVREEDVKFIRLAFCDVYGIQKNISIMPGELPRAFQHGIAVDASAVCGFGGEIHSDLFLHPDAATLVILPWRPEHGKVVRMFCSVAHPDGTVIENDTRNILKKAIADAETAGFSFSFGSELEFYLFKLDENGERTYIPYDNAGYMDIAPEDRGENVRREICLTLERMGIQPESSHHEEGPGQNEIDFRYSDALSAADNTVTFWSVVKTVALRNGLYADFSPKPLKDKPGNGFHINISVKSKDGADKMPYMLAGILERVPEITAFLNPCIQSYERLGSHKAPKYVSWSEENRSQLIRIPAASGDFRRMELRSPDSMTNPYLAFTLLIYAALDGIKNKMELQGALDENLFTADEETLSRCKKLPQSLKEAANRAGSSEFVKNHLPQSLIDLYCIM
ncbi:MAG: glutamine synthetase family protein [Lachnoclostridium sp.]|nr:glutamine synthetase family protein [Lachnospira sp.]MCM1248787.1 glutamine synthetase family protein [Lachnoclostridium sp.]MCM1536694.1 glutamine synthetase family protein [Clostridium sp.]